MSRFFKFHCGLKGRINRLAFFIWMAIYYGIATIFALILEFVGFTEESLNHIGGIIILVIFVPVYLLWGWMSIANTVKRLHDMNLSGWWVFAPALVSVPFIVISGFTSSSTLSILSLLGLALILLVTIVVLYFIKGTEGENRFGSDPRERPVFSVLLGTDA